MTAPRWIRDSIDGQWAGNDVDDKDAEEFARELMEHLPIEAMVSAAATGHEVDLNIPLPLRTVAARRFVTAAVRALTDDAETISLTELYRDASRALDAAGAPYAVDGVMLSLVDRIAWLTAQRPMRLELQRVEAERDIARQEHTEASAAFAQSIADASIERDRLAGERDQLRLALAAITHGKARQDF